MTLAIAASLVPGVVTPAAAVGNTVTFNANGGTGSMTAQTSAVSDQLTSNTFMRTDYLFMGWNTTAGGTGTTYVNRANYPFTSSETLYAQWRAVANVVVLNDAGGVTSSDGLRIKIGAGWRNIVRNNKQQVYVSGTDWPAPGGSSAWNALKDDNPYNGVILRVGSTSICNLEVSFPVAYPVCYLGNDVGSESSTTTSASWDSSVTTLTDALGPTYQAVTVLEKTLAGVMYRITMTTDYTSPNSTADVTYALTIPSGTNAANVRLYDGIDMYLDDEDDGPVTTFTSGGGLNTYVQYNDTAVGGFREISGYPFGSWTGAEYYCLFGGSGDGYGCPDGRGTLPSNPGGNYGPYNGTDYPNTLASDPAIDAGVAIAWDLGVVTAPVTKRSTLYFAAKTAGSGSIAVSPASGPIAGGTSITITGTGTNFVAAASGVLGSTVTVGGSACTPVVFISATSLTCTTTARSAATVDVIVTNPDTTYVTGTGLFTYAPTVTFDANGGTGSMSAQSASTATALTSNSFTRTGYAFAGWNTVAGGTGTAYANGASFPFSASATLYAQWTASGFTATFNANGGTGSMSAQSATRCRRRRRARPRR
ncbi:MAG: InlB B-repeat-containing protein [Actinobacteria bacterium]|nr:InlB B-repeat-containing protein [Actinomycetota bacterium]